MTKQEQAEWLEEVEKELWLFTSSNAIEQDARFEIIQAQAALIKAVQLLSKPAKGVS